jgi:hypothetical protein
MICFIEKAKKFGNKGQWQPNFFQLSKWAHLTWDIFPIGLNSGGGDKPELAIP